MPWNQFHSTREHTKHHSQQSEPYSLTSRLCKTSLIGLCKCSRFGAEPLNYTRTWGGSFAQGCFPFGYLERNCQSGSSHAMARSLRMDPEVFQGGRVDLPGITIDLGSQNCFLHPGLSKGKWKTNLGSPSFPQCRKHFG